jgi:hypothetical protein
MDLCEFPKDLSVLLPPPRSKPKKANDRLFVESETETTSKRAIEVRTRVFLKDFFCINIKKTLCYIEIVLLKTEFVLLLFFILVY